MEEEDIDMPASRRFGRKFMAGVGDVAREAFDRVPVEWNKFKRSVKDPAQALADTWEIRVGKLGWLHALSGCVGAMADHVCPIVMLILYIVALIYGWVGSPFDDTVSLYGWKLWRNPLAIAVPALVYMMFARVSFRRLWTMSHNFEEAGKITQEQYDTKVNWLSWGIMGPYTLIAIVVAFLSSLTLVAFLIIGFFNYSWLGTDFFGLFLGMNIVGVIWIAFIIAYWVSLVFYAIKTLAIVGRLWDNKHLNTVSKVGYFLATAKASKYKNHARLAN